MTGAVPVAEGYRFAGTGPLLGGFTTFDALQEQHRVWRVEEPGGSYWMVVRAPAFWIEGETSEPSKLSRIDAGFSTGDGLPSCSTTLTAAAGLTLTESFPGVAETRATVAFVATSNLTKST